MPFKKGQSGNPSGRTRTRDKHAGAIARAEKRIADKLPWLIDKQFELAEGVYREQSLPDGETMIIYQEKPDYRALAYLIDRIMGKPTERKEIAGTVDGTLEVSFVDYRTGLAGLEAGSEEDSDASGED